MDITKTNQAAGEILEFLGKTDLRPDEKIAALESAAGTIRAVVGAEGLRLMWANVLNQGR